MCGKAEPGVDRVCRFKEKRVFGKSIMGNHMFLKKMAGGALVLALLLISVTGCGNLQDFQMEPPTGKEDTDEFTSLGLSPEFDYEVPESLPSILVDQMGYAVGSKKVAMINGETPPDRKSVV